MNKNKSMKKRLAVFVLWEKNGLVRGYVEKYLEGLFEVANKVYVVVNGDLSQDGQRRLENIGCKIIHRANEGLDFFAYRDALNAEQKTISSYDEIILCNCSCYGPVDSFIPMFNEMDKRKVDFWGITEWPLNEGGYEGTWILSYFMVFRPSIFLSLDWKEYWNNLIPIKSREEAILLHEIKFTPYFSEKGYTYDVYCPTTKKYIDPTIEAPDELVIKYNCPIIKRKAFCVDYQRYLDYTRVLGPRRLLSFLDKTSLYDTNLILEDLLATQHLFHLKNSLQLNYVLPSRLFLEKQNCSCKKRIVVCAHLYYEDILDQYLNYLDNCPKFIDIFITSPKQTILDKAIEFFKQKQRLNVKTQIVNPRGRAESAFLVATKDFILDYDLACIVHDKKSSFLRPGCIGEEFGYHNLDSLLGSEEYVYNIVHTFECNPKLGILEPVNLMFSVFKGLYGNEWGANFLKTKELLDKLDIDVPIDANVPPVAPMGAMFWFRPKALEKLIKINWEYIDFPEEPLPLDGSLIHVIERSYPYFAQEAGYYTGWVTSDYLAENHITNLSFLLRAKNISPNMVTTPNDETKTTVIPAPNRFRNSLRVVAYSLLPPPLYQVGKRLFFKIFS